MSVEKEQKDKILIFKTPEIRRQFNGLTRACFLLHRFGHASLSYWNEFEANVENRRSNSTPLNEVQLSYLLKKIIFSRYIALSEEGYREEAKRIIDFRRE